MKKILVAIFAFFYLLVSSGFTVHLHYCMNRLADWSLENHSAAICSKCGMKKSDEKDNGCCKDEHKYIKHSTDQKTAETGTRLFHPVFSWISFPVLAITVENPSSLRDQEPVSHAPPRVNRERVYVRNCIFRI